MVNESFEVAIVGGPQGGCLAGSWIEKNNLSGNLLLFPASLSDSPPALLLGDLSVSAWPILPHGTLSLQVHKPPDQKPMSICVLLGITS